MILVAGLTPAWQQILSFDQFQLGEVNRATEAHWCASGKVLNVGIAAHRLGAETTILTPLGGKPGEQTRLDCDSLGVSLEIIPTATPTRVCTTLIDRRAGTITELVENANPLSGGELDRFMTRYRTLVKRASIVVLTGSLPAGIPDTVYRDLLRETSVPALLDIRGPELLTALPERPWLVKPNREELAKTFRKTLAAESDVQHAIRDLITRGAQNVVISQGSRPLQWFTAQGEQSFNPPSVQVVNPIGCGDSLAAGIAVGATRALPLEESLRWGLAAAAANAAQLLPVRFTPEEVNACR